MNRSAGVVQIVYLTTSTIKRPSRLHVRIDLPADEDVPFTIARELIAISNELH